MALWEQVAPGSWAASYRSLETISKIEVVRGQTL